VFVDNQLGISLQIGGEKEESIVKFYDSYVYGEDEDIALDCPPGTGDCMCVNKTGFLLNGMERSTKAVWPLNIVDLPFYK